MIAAVLVCQIGFALAVAMIRSRTNEAAAAESVQLVASRLQQLQEQLGSITADYNNWNDAHDAIAALDLRWIYDNYAMSATDGQLFDGLILMDGALTEPWAWSASEPRAEPLPSFLTPGILDRIRAGVADLVPGAWQTFDLMTVLDGELVLLSATHVLPSDSERLERVDSANTPIAIFAETLGAGDLAGLATSLFVEGLTFSNGAAPGRAELAVTGLDGERLGVLSWLPRQPGNDLVQGMAPVLLAMGLLNTALAVAAAGLARSRAKRLIEDSQEAARLARTDVMTGLPNRLAFGEHLKVLEQGGTAQLAVLFLDLDGFKAVNDSLGHTAGDALVAAVAERLAVCSNAFSFLARLGGDEFVFVLASENDITRKADALTRAVTEAMAQPFSVQGTTVRLGLSQGLALRQEPGIAVEELVRRADLAMYRAKRDRLADAQLYTPELDGHVRRDREMEMALRTALDRPEEFTILYQPVLSARDHSFVRAEALARWDSGTMGAVPPSEFIALAERTALISRLGALLLSRTFADLVRCPSLKVSLNLSPVQLRDPNFLLDLDARMAHYGLNSRRIQFELTEGVMIGRADRARDRLEELRRRGFSIALDDFGTGFSSLAYLTSMPIDTIKIDQVFLSQGEEVLKNLALIRSIVHLGHTMGKTVVCEGVETAAQASALAEAGCDELQGYHFAQPMPLASLVAVYPTSLAMAVEYAPCLSRPSAPLAVMS